MSQVRLTRLFVAAALLGLCACYGESLTSVSTEKLPVPPDVVVPLTCEEAPPPATPTRLLTREEYNNTVRDLLGDTTRPALAFPKEPQVLGFENNTSAHRVNSLLVNAYLDAAESIAARAVLERRAQLLPCDPVTLGEASCGEQFVVAFATRAYRRPPTAEELDGLRSFFEKVRAAEGFDTAVEWTVQVVLQAPQFLYRVEVGAPMNGATRNLTGYELASRLSYFLWSSMPDDVLLTAAANGELETPEGLEQHARRMIADDRARDTVKSFFRQWLHFDGIEKLEKDTTAIPQFKPELAASWRQALDLFVEDSVWNGDGKLSTLFTSPALYMNEVAGEVYGRPMPGVTGFQRMDMGASERAGILTQPGLLAALAGPFDSSPVQRGVFIREKFLCENLPPPPADVAVTPPDPDPNATTRERFAEHTANGACMGCHTLIDPIGFGFEQYDALGRFRTTENGLPVDASGEIVNAKDSALTGSFNGAVELAHRFAQSTRVQDCVATQWFRFAMGRLEVDGDGCSLQTVRNRFYETGGDFRELLIAMTQTPAFRTRAAPQEQP